MDTQAYFSLNPWWEKKDFETGIPREDYLGKLFKRAKRRQIEVIVGSRRVGKTTLLRQMIKKFLKEGIRPADILYVSCDFAKAIGVPLSEHLSLFRQIFSHLREKRIYLFLDEVQESPRWQVELKSLYDNENVKIICSGSTSTLIKSHGGKLTGRQISTVVYPLNFKEFLIFRRVKPDYSQGYLLEKEVERYLAIGGYPENVISPSDEYLSSLLDDIFLRDLVRLYPIKNLGLIKDLFKLIAASISNRVSFNKMAKVLGISLDTVKDYIDYLENAFLVRKLSKWSTSYSEKTYSTKKIYLLDNGLKTLLTGKGNWGAKAENAVFWRLVREYENIGYFAESEKEIDFVLGDTQSPLPIEVKYTNDPDKLTKGLTGLKLFLTRHPQTKQAKVITRSFEKKTKFQNTDLAFIPLWRFLLEEYRRPK